MNIIKTFRGWPLLIKIIVSVVAVLAILQQVSRFNWWRYQQNIKANTTPHKQAVDITRVPSEVKSFLSDENLQKMDENGMNIYTGSNPPNIEGSYEFKEMVTKYDQAGNSLSIVPYTYIFTNQKADNTLVFTYHSEKDYRQKKDVGAGQGVFISGEGKCFSVYLSSSGQSSEQCRDKTAEIFSACKTEKGLVDMDQGTLWTEVSDGCTAEDSVPVGYLRIFSQKSLAPRK